MDGSCGDEVMIVLLGRNLVYIFLGIEADFTPLGSPEVFYHLPLVYILLQAQIYHSIVSGIQQVIAFILCIMESELTMGKLIGRMNLQAQVTASHGIQEVETDGEILTEAGPYLFAKHITAIHKYQVLSGELYQHTVQIQIKAVLLWHAVETPSVIHLLTGQVAYFLHPLATPGSGIKEGYHAEGLAGCAVHTLTELLAANHLGFLTLIAVYPVEDATRLYQQILVAVADYPVVEESAFILS
jgi:hypothetical protein